MGSPLKTDPTKAGPVPVLVIYRPKKGKEKELEALVRQHGAKMRATGLLSPDPVRCWRAKDKEDHGQPGEYFVEVMAWRDAAAPGIAHQTPEVMSVWEPMGPLLEELRITHMEPLATA